MPNERSYCLQPLRDSVKEIAAYNSEFARKNGETELFKKHEILFDDEDQQQNFHDFIGRLKTAYPGCDTIASRIMNFIDDHE